ncbi:coiled-coil domain-containing protein 103 [Centropristis striata]|uniref:coiled-coil domain-containing protein 103 n=1 Tax=Centropristis striata TaxID=184440 RepID=UPI0027DFBD7F|nr:coiled-coil domain-containing protein 103 [Centropristis striata]XP_059204461.1 coiled-coil domain-containing protein 103 [Centropristis striata]XP_059204462.1 coiled-coil domain-containing protein 103 [Centropristis striata]
MATSQSDVIDFSALDQELQAALESDRIHQNQNQAKLRAVSQGVPYSQFRDLVLASHLRPLEPKDKQASPWKQTWRSSDAHQ